jgi:hypothetical protein
VTAIEDARTEGVYSSCGRRRPCVPGEPELRWSGSAELRTELRTALTKTGWVARVGADRLFPTLPTAVAAYEQWLHDHPADQAADDQAPLAARDQSPDD